MFLVCLLPGAAKMIAEHQHPGLFEEIRKIKTLQMTIGAIVNACVSAVMLKQAITYMWLYWSARAITNLPPFSTSTATHFYDNPHLLWKHENNL